MILEVTPGGSRSERAASHRFVENGFQIVCGDGLGFALQIALSQQVVDCCVGSPNRAWNCILRAQGSGDTC